MNMSSKRKLKIFAVCRAEGDFVGEVDSFDQNSGWRGSNIKIHLRNANL